MNGDGIIKVLLAVVGVAIVAVLVSKNSQTPDVLNKIGGAFGTIIKAATGPVAGAAVVSSFG